MAKRITEEEIEQILGRGIEEVIIRDHLARDLAKGTPLRIKLGADPTAPDLHLGHAVVLRKLRQFQELGHTIVFIIGDYTALIGDPSGRSKTRPALDAKTIEKNAETYFKQVGKILDLKKTEVHRNSEWFREMSVADFIVLSSKFTTARILERDDFEKRLKEGTEMGHHETLYPIMQAQDSVAINASVEIGGTDQKFNMLAGRDLQRKMGMDEQDVITCPLLIGTDGEKKMSKSLGNYVGLTDEPEDMYGKVMSIPDRLIVHYFQLATDVPDAEVEKISRGLSKNENPRDYKARLAREIVSMYHGKKAAGDAERAFEKTFRNKEVPEDVRECTMKNLPAGKAGEKCTIVDCLVLAKLAASKSEARRVIMEGGVKLDGRVVKDSNTVISIPKSGVLIQKGKRHFVRIVR